jgi:hypothetical protein
MLVEPDPQFVQYPHRILFISRADGLLAKVADFIFQQHGNAEGSAKSR